MGKEFELLRDIQLSMYNANRGLVEEIYLVKRKLEEALTKVTSFQNPQTTQLGQTKTFLFKKQTFVEISRLKEDIESRIRDIRDTFSGDRVSELPADPYSCGLVQSVFDNNTESNLVVNPNTLTVDALCDLADYYKLSWEGYLMSL